MGNTVVKICGLQDVEVLKSMLNLPVDYIGFIFAKSRRQVTLELAAELILQLKSWQNGQQPGSVGVFVNPELDYLDQVMNRVRLDVIQLHGQEDADFCLKVKQRFGVKVFKVIQVNGNGIENSHEQLVPKEYIGAIDALLLDTFDPVYGGGSGQTFAWEQISQYQMWCEEHNIPLFVAGGLQPSNVGELITNYHPYGVDVSSGVESNGLKDIEKIKAFVERVKQI
ncbi:phosphoribosylanthranilate isomerase [Paenibacillus crassostreae]|uniref:N-(5'-phosphoribosyl)anthranilate isomerase n=1 Tax=Paenibacillus crassostreae TaxID=1763538 RepID=A0A167DK86_9BACL|nr:phosphoribosylanthranilate isomerase [Paenibacillus crassostreae]AOZ91361.1 N-(5'-phosphoribosyl)anthranilate isomerase [Paenibacillus crassostreae]OAB74480.1 N-(5'-phosphoribosyl)anthranilate isomerase [Paenibacillus crassostreae]